jgi:hypothetical protein
LNSAKPSCPPCLLVGIGRCLAALSPPKNRTCIFQRIRLEHRTTHCSHTPGTLTGYPVGDPCSAHRAYQHAEYSSTRILLHVTSQEPTTSPRCECPLDYWKPHQQDHCGPPTYLRRLLKWFASGSRAPTPEGSLLPFGQGTVATPIHPITGRPSLPPSSSTRSPIGSSCESLSLTGGLRAYHVPR